MAIPSISYLFNANVLLVNFAIVKKKKKLQKGGFGFGIQPYLFAPKDAYFCYFEFGR